MDKELLEKIKKLREETGAPIGLCKEALENTKGNIEEAKKYLIKKGEALLEKRGEKIAGQGIIEGYIHFNGKVGALVEVRAETDFVAKNPEFKQLAHEVALQVATMNPKYLSRDTIPQEVLEAKKEELMADIKDKPKDIKEKIVEGRLEKWFEEVCLLEQRYIKDENLKIKDLISNFANKFGEKIEIKRFVRLSIND
jgi:elongation factor Ts